MKKILSAVLLLLLLGLCACARTPKDEVTGITINADNAKYWYLSGQEIDPTGHHRHTLERWKHGGGPCKL